MSPTDPSPGRRALEHAFAALGYFALTAFYLRPLLRLFGTHIAPDPGDPVFCLILLKWGMHQIRHGLSGFWDLPFFFPAQGVTTYSEHLIGPAAFGTLLTSLQPNPLVVYNTLLLASFALSGWTTWYVLRRRGLGATAAFLGGCMFAFCPIRWDQLSHLQILLMQWIPLTLWSWDRLLERPAWRRAALFLAVYALHVTGGTYFAYMIHVPMLIVLLYRAPALWHDRRAAAKVLVPAGLLAAMMLAAVFLPYVRASRFQERSAAEIREFGASLASYGTFSFHNVYGSWSDAWRRPENSLFPGFTVTVLALVAAARALPRRRTPPRRPLAGWQKAVLGLLLTAALVGLVRGEVQTWELAGRLDAGLSVEPEALKITSWLLALGLVALVLRRLWGGNWPLTFRGLDPFERGLLVSAAVCFLLTFNAVYIPLSRQIPGLSGMRVPARFGIFVTFALVVFAARKLDRLLRRSGPRRALVSTLLAGLLLVELAPKPLQWTPMPREADFPRALHWLARQDDVKAVLMLPFGDALVELSNMYLGTLAWQPMVNGYSGYLPRNYTDFRANCCSPVPQGPELDRLRLWGVTHIVLRPEALEKKWQRRIFKDWQRRPDVALAFAGGGYRVYRILPVAEPGG